MKDPTEKNKKNPKRIKDCFIGCETRGDLIFDQTFVDNFKSPFDDDWYFIRSHNTYLKMNIK